MRINPITYHRYNKAYNQNIRKDTQFTGQAYDIEMHCGGTGYGPGCEIFKDGKSLTRSTSGMYDGHLAAVENAVKKIHPGILRVQTIKDTYDKGKIYIADPEETINDSVYKRYNYVITEDAPSIPDISQFDRKFHTFGTDSRDFNEILSKIKDYYSRMLIADTKEKAHYEVKQTEDNINLQTAKDYKKHCQAQLAIPGKDHSRYRDELNTQDYYIYVNNESLRTDKEKIDYYTTKNIKTQEKIKFINELAEIMNKTGDSFIKRDIIASEKSRYIDFLENNINEHMDIMTKIRLTELEKENLKKQLEIVKKRHKALLNQANKGNCRANMGKNSSSGIIATKHNVYSHYDEVEAAEEQIHDIDKKLKELSNRRHEIQKNIQKNKNEIKKYSEEIKPILEKIQPIYDELEAYYKKNYPFNN